jgi:hypothetical protein
MMRYLLQEIFAITLTLAITSISFSMVMELISVKRKWVSIARSLGGFFMLLTGMTIVIYIVNKAVMTLKYGNIEQPFLALHMIFEGILVATFAYILFLSIRNLIRKIKHIV